MHHFIGHLAAVIVFVVVAGVLFTVRQRGQIESVEETIRYTATAHAIDLARMFEHDVINMLDEQVATTSTTCTADAHGVTTQFSFPSRDPITLDEVTVTYRAVATGETVVVGTRTLRLYTYEREVSPLDGPSSVSPGTSELTGFEIEFVGSDGAMTSCTAAPGLRAAPANLDRVRVRFVAAVPNVARLTADQSAADRLVLRPYSTSFRPVNLAR